jgi:hypothetical protein
MLTVTTPIRLGKYSYDRLIGGVRGDWDLRARRVEVHIGPGRADGDDIIFATKETEADKSRVIPPPVLLTLTIDDPQQDPALALLWQRIQLVIEAVEEILVTNASLAEKVFQAGEEEVPLDCTFSPYVGTLKTESREKIPKLARQSEEPI